MITHDCDSDRIGVVAYDSKKNLLYASFRPKGVWYEYSDTAPSASGSNPSLALVAHFHNIRTAKGRDVPIGPEKPNSEGSYFIHHVVGTKNNPSPFTYRLLGDEEAESLGLGSNSVSSGEIPGLPTGEPF